MNPPTHMRTLILLGAALAPAGGVALVRWLAPHAGPAIAAAHGSTGEVIEPVRPLLAPELTGKQPALAAALKGREVVYTSPFVVPLSEAAREGLLAKAKGGAKTEKPPEFAITSIVTGAQTFAVINGKAHRVGDDLEGGWKVESIDGSRREATLSHAEHGKLVVRIKAELE